MTVRPDLSICVCTRNAAMRIDRFLPPLVECLASSELATELIIVEDGSTDTTLQMARSLAPDALVIPHGRNRGLPAARNTAARTANAEWLLFIDDDATISTTAIMALWSGRQQDTCLVPLVRGPEGELQNSMTLMQRFLEPRFKFSDEPAPTVPFPTGTCFLIHKQTYWNAGGFDERFFPTYFDDTAFGFQLHRQGISIRMHLAAEVVHYKHGAHSSDTVPDRVLRALFENRWVFCMTQLSGWRRAAVMALGLPRTAMESARRRSLGPIEGYLRACRRLVELTRPWPLPGLEGDR
jgi:glycosyltransferase involved in cell wall biosynthesis